MKHSLPLALLAACWLASCSSNTSSSENAGGTATDSTATAPEAGSAGAGVKPVEMPDPHIPGYSFPTAAATIDGWVSAQKTASIYLHGWGIWTSLSMRTDQVQGSDTLRAYETWPTPGEIAQGLLKAEENGPKLLLAKQPRTLNRHLRTPRQFFRDAEFRKALKAGHAANNPQNDSNAVFESVAYNPAAAQFTIDNKLLLQSTLNKMVQAGTPSIPDFPTNAVAIKPVYEVVPGPERSKHPYRMKVWANIPSSLNTKPQGFPQEDWTSCVFVDIRNQGQGRGEVLKDCGKRTPQTTYNLRDFVYHTLTAQEAADLYQEAKQNGSIGPDVKPYAAGDYAILVAMHITTREITRWTWQTVWWAPDPERVPAPSSAAVVKARPSQLQGAPRHYGMAIAYQMISPVQPLTGGSNKGTSIYAYNPYLEAPFTPGAFNQIGTVITNGVQVVNNVGMRTNCMSCHGQANYNPNNLSTGLGYVGDTYVDLNNPAFKGTLKVDFLWSIQAESVNDSSAAKAAQ